jgi:hypothetical protein
MSNTLYDTYNKTVHNNLLRFIYFINIITKIGINTLLLLANSFDSIIITNYNKNDKYNNLRIYKDYSNIRTGIWSTKYQKLDNRKH